MLLLLLIPYCGLIIGADIDKNEVLAKVSRCVKTRGIYPSYFKSEHAKVVARKISTLFGAKDATMEKIEGGLLMSCEVNRTIEAPRDPYSIINNLYLVASMSDNDVIQHIHIIAQGKDKFLSEFRTKEHGEAVAILGTTYNYRDALFRQDADDDKKQSRVLLTAINKLKRQYSDHRFVSYASTSRTEQFFKDSGVHEVDDVICLYTIADKILRLSKDDVELNFVG